MYDDWNKLRWCLGTVEQQHIVRQRDYDDIMEEEDKQEAKVARKCLLWGGNEANDEEHKALSCLLYFYLQWKTEINVLKHLNYYK